MSDKTSKNEVDKKTKKPARQEVRYDHNPFSENMVVPTKKAAVKLSRMGSKDHVLVDQDSGEMSGTHVTAYRKVDSERFLKLFTQNIALTFDLNAAGVKALNVLAFKLQEKGIERDQVVLDKFALQEFLKAHEDRDPPLKLSMATFQRGLAQLVDAKIIAMAMRQGWYYINPNFIFNGDRIAFTTVIERDAEADKEKGEKLPFNEDQQDLPLE